MRYIRLDDLSPIELTSWEVLWGPETRAEKVKKSHLAKIIPGTANISDRGKVGLVPHLSISANWAVRLVEANSLSARAARIAYLVARDSAECFYCGTFLFDPTRIGGLMLASDVVSRSCEIEHIVPTAHGGPDHASNLCLTCPPCNRAMGALSGAEKVRLAIKMKVGSMNISTSKEVR